MKARKLIGIVGAGLLAIQPNASAQRATPPPPPTPGDNSAHYSPTGQFSVVESKKAYGSAGGDAWVFRSSDGKCIGSIITDELTDKATAAFKRLDRRITDKMLVKQEVEFEGWTKDGLLKVEVYSRYELHRSKSEAGEIPKITESQFVYHANMKVEGPKLVVVAGEAEQSNHTY